MNQRNELDEWIQGLPIPEFLLNRFNRMPIAVRSHVRRAVCRMRSIGIRHVDTSLLERFDAELLASRPPRTQLQLLLTLQLKEGLGKPRQMAFARLESLWITVLGKIKHLFETDKDPRCRDSAAVLTEDTMDLAALILMHVMSQPTMVYRTRSTTDVKPH